MSGKTADHSHSREREAAGAGADAHDPLAALAAKNAELQRRLKLRTKELDDLAQHLARLESNLESRDPTVVQPQREVSELTAERLRLMATVDALALQNEGLTQALSERDQREARLSLELNELARGKAELDARLKVVESELHERDLMVEELERERQETAEILRRAVSSRAWRWGHAVSRLLRRAAFRRTMRQTGALDVLVERLDARPELRAGPETGAEPSRQSPWQ